MPHYTDEDGNPVDATSPRRCIWLSNRCGFWTDDWDRIHDNVCPECGSTGIKIPFERWQGGITRYQDEKCHKFVQFVEEIKEMCFAGSLGLMRMLWEFCSGGDDVKPV